MKIRTGDTVVVISGKDKGKTGTILRVLESKHRVVVASVNMRTKHLKRTPQSAGQRIQYEASIHMSNIMLIDPKSKKRTRVGHALDKEGHVVRIAKRSGEPITHVAAAASTPKKKVTAPAMKEDGKKESATTKATTGVKPAAQPFWKRLGFGADALADDAESKEAPHSKEDHSVPDQGSSSSRMSHQRGS
jgi:large subunit ribosomal protein L24